MPRRGTDVLDRPLGSAVADRALGEDLYPVAGLVRRQLAGDAEHIDALPPADRHRGVEDHDADLAALAEVHRVRRIGLRDPEDVAVSGGGVVDGRGPGLPGGIGRGDDHVEAAVDDLPGDCVVSVLVDWRIIGDPGPDEFFPARWSKRSSNKGGIDMGKLIVTEFVSVDGVFEDPGGSENFEHGGWSFEFDRGE